MTTVLDDDLVALRDLGTDVLHDSGTVHADAAGDITDEAGDTEAHVLGVAQHDQRNGNQTNDAAADEQVSFFFHFFLLQIFNNKR